MPREGKGKRNNRNNKGPQQLLPSAVRRIQYEDEDDGESINSDVTCSTLNSDNEEEEISESEQYEATLKQAIEMAQEKSQSLRVRGIQGLIKTMQARPPMDGELDNLYVTISDIAERSIKRGSSVAEKVAAAKLSSVIMLASLSTDGDGITDTVYRSLQPTLLVVCQDPTVSAVVREEVCRSVAVQAFFGAIDYTDLQESINTLHKVFSKALPKGNGELPNLQAATLLMHAAALQGFHLLLGLTYRHDVITRAPSLLAELLSLLETRELDMRTEAGMGVALIYELARQESGDFRWRGAHQLMDVLNELATDSHKHRGKKERKQQRAVFRSVVTSIEEEEYSPESVTIGCKKAKGLLIIDSWEIKYRYDCICHVLEMGTNAHLLYNDGLSANFDIKDCSGNDMDGKKERNIQRRYNGLVQKQRILQRNKNRDNRAIAATYED